MLSILIQRQEKGDGYKHAHYFSTPHEETVEVLFHHGGSLVFSNTGGLTSSEMSQVGPMLRSLEQRIADGEL